MYGFERAVMIFAMAIVYVLSAIVLLVKGDKEAEKAARIQKHARAQAPPRGQVHARAQTPAPMQAASRAQSASYMQKPSRAQK